MAVTLTGHDVTYSDEHVGSHYLVTEGEYRYLTEGNYAFARMIGIETEWGVPWAWLERSDGGKFNLDELYAGFWSYEYKGDPLRFRIDGYDGKELLYRTSFLEGDLHMTYLDDGADTAIGATLVGLDWSGITRVFFEIFYPRKHECLDDWCGTVAINDVRVTAAAPAPVPVPLPATAGLLLGGIALLAGRRLSSQGRTALV